MQTEVLEHPIYLDYAATTPVDERVLDAMLPCFRTAFGNAASLHRMGRAAAEAVERAREQVSDLVGCFSRDVIWTSGATEANNLAIKGFVRSAGRRSPHIVSQRIEHKAVLDPLDSLRREGVDVTLLEVDANGQIDPSVVEKAIRPETVLVTLMAANNELGTLTPLREIGAICGKAGIAIHTDASQAAGKIPINARELGLTLMSVSGHKLYGPKGIGALIFRREAGTKILTPIIDGGGHERGMRSGTLNVPAIVGLGVACEIAVSEMTEDAERVRGLRDDFESTLLAEIPDTFVNGVDSPRLPNISNMSFVGVDAESLLLALDGIAASTGSACTAASIEPSHVLKALGLPVPRQKSSVRFSFGKPTTLKEVRRALEMIIPTVHSLRRLADEAFI
ncbi:cysteine desulfurase family protein [Aquisphaera insulae]|uniref:cysteine desulfurase family protein n=1 Tax=Aquisphaera insulae TaxID=2712864 RepID=UPI0013EA83B6|nr:cysteine desulfurase family protein [Aquisphaera insulae]